MNHRAVVACISCLSLALCVPLIGSAEPPTTGDRAAMDFFESKIRPVLVKECYSCHSAQAAASGKLRGQLLLDSRDGLRKGGESGPAVVAGKPDDSLLIGALRHETFEMPPKGKLADPIIADFVRWVEMGAPDPREGIGHAEPKSMDVEAGKNFWSFQKLALTPELQSIADGRWTQVDAQPSNADIPLAWARTPVDHFILQKLQQQKLTPNGNAHPRILVRRAWFDLLGLPPTPEEMEHWVQRLTAPQQPIVPKKDQQADHQVDHQVNHQAWSQLIDHLLMSPHYGERWARHWMDVARFAESHGYEQDYDRPTAYHYRDFLIQAFNSDMPYDQFVRWQLAGDQLAPDQPLAWMATGFLGGGAFPTQLTENEFESARYDELDDMVATTGVAFLGLSVGCARCHDHKFDPIPSLDYYRLAATFTKAIRTEKEFDLEPAENERRRQEYAQRLAQAQQQLDTIEAEQLPSALVKWLNSAAALPEASQWQLISVAPSSSAKTKFKALDDGSFLATGKAPAKEVLTFVLPSSVKQLAALRVEALADESLSRKGPGRASNGNFVLTNVAATIGLPAKAAKASKAAKESAVRWSSAEATHQQNSASLSVAASIDDDPASGWAVDGQIGRDQAAVFRLAEPLTVPDRSQVTIRLSFEHPNAQHVLGRIRLSTSGSQQAPLSLGVAGPGNSVVEALRTLRASSPPDDRAKLPTWIADHQSQWPVALDWFRGQHAPWQQASQELNKLKADGAAVKLNKVLVTSEGLPHLPHHADGRGFPHFYPVTHHLRRGDVTQKGEAVEPGYLQVLISKRDAPSDTAPVPDSDSKAAKPVMPARSALSYWLTDSQQGAGHLAARVMVNRLWQHHFGQGLVTTPNDFGTSGERPTHPELLDWLAIQLIDHDWRLKPIHKQIMLSSVYMQSADTQAVQSPAISTQTDARHLIDPDNKLWWRRVPRRLEAEAVRDAMLAVSGTLDDQMFGPGTMNQDMKRRSVYFFIKRSDLIPMMMLFDWPEHLVSIGARSTTTIAPQALMFMNSPQGRSYAEALADKVHSDSLPNLLPEAITAAYLRVFGRAPSDMELGQAVRFVQQQASLRGGDADRDQTHKHRQLAMADLCQMLLSSNEFMYIE